MTPSTPARDRHALSDGAAARPRRVLHVLEAVGGGTALVLELQVRFTDPQRFTLDVVIPPAPTDPLRIAELADSAFAERIAALGATVHRVPMVGGKPAPLANTRAALRLARLMGEHRYDIVHSHSSIAGYTTRVAARVAGMKATVHSPQGFAFGEHASPLRSWLFRTVERGLGRWTRLLIACSESEHRQAVEARIVAPQRVVVIENPLDTESVRRELHDRSAMRSELGVAPSDLLVGAVARLVPQKGIATLVAAAPEVLAAVPEARFVVVGDGRLRGELEAATHRLGVDRRLSFVGNKSNIHAVMTAFDVLAMPSLWEGLPYTPLEAMLLGVPVVGSDVTGIEDVVQSPELGILVPPRDSRALAAALIDVLHDPARRARLADRAEEHVRQRFDARRSLERIMAAYDEILEQASA